MNNDAIKLISHLIKDCNHHRDPLTQEIDADKWKAAGEPCLWKLVETRAGVEVYEDRAYGKVVAIYNGKAFEMHDDTIIHEDFIVINKHYFNAPRRIWM